MPDAVDRVLQAVLATPALRERQDLSVWLFGSRARGAATEASDVDLAVLCEPPLGLDRATVMDEASTSAGLQIDLVDLATAAPVLAWEVVTTGRLVMERHEEATKRFVRHARYARSRPDWQRRRRTVTVRPAVVLARATRRRHECRRPCADHFFAARARGLTRGAGPT
jgi:predicted nucleotidyltransferase